jgi:hypothetical protein
LLQADALAPCSDIRELNRHRFILPIGIGIWFYDRRRRQPILRHYLRRATLNAVEQSNDWLGRILGLQAVKQGLTQIQNGCTESFNPIRWVEPKLDARHSCSLRYRKWPSRLGNPTIKKSLSLSGKEREKAGAYAVAEVAVLD